MIDQVLVVAWLVLAHLVADFVLQNDWIATNKGRSGQAGAMALLVHGSHVALCLVPAVVAFGGPGLLYLVLVAGSHMVVDRWKVSATRRAVELGQARARARAAAGAEAASTFGAAWTPIPGLLFIADQVLHLTIAIVGWLVVLEGAALTGQFVDAVNTVLRHWDRSVVHAAALTAVVLVSVLLVNTRGAFYFVLALTTRRDLEADPAPNATAPASERQAGVPTGAAARPGTTIAALERLLIVALVLTGAQLVAGFVILADTLARWRQLEDRAVAEYHLLSSLASFAVAFGSAMVAQAALASLT